MRRTRPLNTTGIGLAAAALIVIFAVLTFVPLQFPWSSTRHYVVQAGAFGEMNPGAWVELSGIKVGTVDGVSYQQGHALLQLSVDGQFATRLHSDTSAQIRPHGLLGPKYVYLTGGSTGQLPDGATIPISRTQVSQDFDQVLNALQPDVRANLKTIFVELGKAAEGRGTDMHTTFQSLGQQAADLATTTDVLHQRDQDLADLITASEQLDRDLQYAPIDAQIADTDRVLTGLVQVNAAFGDGIDQTAAVLERLNTALEGNSQNVAAILARAPGTLQHLRTLLAMLQTIESCLNPSLPNLMTATVETESAFNDIDTSSGRHMVRVEAGAFPTTASPALCPGRSSGLAAPSNSLKTSNVPITGGKMSDQKFAALLLGH
jgi:phospholipid/cholesterol/gamma-HCH transport system substrate-binding protein